MNEEEKTRILLKLKEKEESTDHNEPTDMSKFMMEAKPPNLEAITRPCTFELTVDQVRKFKQWHYDHLQEKHKGRYPYAGAIGGSLTFSFTGTSLGEIATVKCSCGEECNLTNFDDW